MVMDSDEESDEEGWEDVEQEEEEEQSATCLFCENSFPGADATLKHCHITHDFDIKHLQHIYRLDCFGYIKMINYIRRHASLVIIPLCVCVPSQ